jgi:IS30 family transposase
MPSVTVSPASGRYLSFAEREEIAVLRARGAGVRGIARRLGRSPSTISRELRRNAATRGGGLEYRATTAQWHADMRARRPKPAKLAVNPELRRYVQDRLSGAVQRPNGITVDGPQVQWIGRRHGRRKDRRWARSWSPEQISNRLRLDFPDDQSMRVCHEAIYQSLYVQGRGALRGELTACLRTGRALRVPRARVRGRGKSFVTDEVMISQRPAEAADRAVPGHWEGDLILGLGSSAIGTLVERSSRFVMLLHLPPMDRRDGPRAKNGTALTGHGAQAVRDAIADAIRTLPEQLRRSLTWDQGAEMAQHAQLRIDTGLAVYFLRPAEPVAARHQREHQRAAAPILPERNRPRPARRRRPLSRRRRPEQPPPQDPRLENPRRSAQRAPESGLSPRQPTIRLSLRGSESPRPNTARPAAPTTGPPDGAHAAIAAPARPPGEPPRRQPPPQPSSRGEPSATVARSP